jgi:hypothetical protein
MPKLTSSPTYVSPLLYTYEQPRRRFRAKPKPKPFTGQIRELYRERAALERDYAGRLSALAAKAVDKKNKKMSRAVVGDEPFKPWSEEALLQR